MPDEWKSIGCPPGYIRKIHYERQLEIRSRPIGGDRYEVALLRAARYGPGSADEAPDVYVKVVRGMRAAARRVAWIKAHIDHLLRGEQMAADHEQGVETVDA